MNTEEFHRAYQAALDATGQDYLIPWRVHQAIWSAQNCSRLEGDFIELGTGRGFTMAAVLSSLSAKQLGGRKVFLCDVFQMPKVSGLGMKKFSEVYAETPEGVRRYFSKWPNVHLVVGNVRRTLSTLDTRRVAFAHIDLNDGQTEVEMLDRLWPILVDGAIVLLDDYANRGFEESYRAANEFFRVRGHPVLTTAAGQGIVIVRKADV